MDDPALHVQQVSLLFQTTKKKHGFEGKAIQMGKKNQQLDDDRQRMNHVYQDTVIKDTIQNFQLLSPLVCT